MWHRHAGVVALSPSVNDKFTLATVERLQSMTCCTEAIYFKQHFDRGRRGRRGRRSRREL
jgi:hypothetical protein